MFTIASKPLRIAMFGVFISAVLHAIAPIFHGFDMPLTLFIPIALLYVGFIFGLQKELPWLPPIVLACMIIGGMGSLFEIYRISPVSTLLLLGIALADFTAAGALISYLKNKPA